MSAGVRRIVWLLLTVVVATWCKQSLSEHAIEGGQFNRRAAPNSLFGYVAFGAFKPLFLQQLWAKADRFEREGRFWELIDVQERIAALEPNDPKIWRRQAYLLAFNVAQQEPNDVKRWRFYKRVLSRLNVGIDHNPNDYQLRELKFTILYNLISVDPYCSRQLQRTTKRNGLMTSLAEAVAIEEDFPNRVGAFDLVITAAEESVEWLANRGRFEDAADLLVELEKRVEAFPQRFPKVPHRLQWAESYRFWQNVMREWPKIATKKGTGPYRLTDEPKFLAQLSELSKHLKPNGMLRFDVESETLDAALLNLIHMRAIGLCQVEVLSKNHDLVLRCLESVHRIAHLAEGRVGFGMPYYSEAYVNLFETFVGRDRALCDTLDAGAKDRLKPLWRRELDELDQQIRARAGRSDSFKERMQDARR